MNLLKPRPIQFRAYRPSTGGIVDSSRSMATILQRHLNGYPQASTGFGWGPEETTGPDYYVIMQYSGLDDKDGAPIYEGDVLRYWDAVATVEFHSGSFWAVFEKRERLLFDINHMCRVSGTVFDNLQGEQSP